MQPRDSFISEILGSCRIVHRAHDPYRVELVAERISLPMCIYFKTILSQMVFLRKQVAAMYGNWCRQMSEWPPFMIRYPWAPKDNGATLFPGGSFTGCNLNGDMGTWRDVLAGRALRSHLCSKMLLSRFSAPEKYVFGETLVVVQRIRVASIVMSPLDPGPLLPAVGTPRGIGFKTDQRYSAKKTGLLSTDL